MGGNDLTFELRWILVPVVLLLACGIGRPLGGQEGDPPGNRTIHIYYTGDTRGILEPCGCTSGQLGGISRRDAYLEGVRGGENVLVLDLGGVIDRPGRQPAIKFEVSLDAMSAMRYALINVGPGDLLMGVDRLIERAARGEGRFVSANLSRVDRGRPFPARVEVEVGSLAIGVYGVLSPSALQGAGGAAVLSIDDPVTALEAAIASEEPDSIDLRVLLAHVDLEEARQIVEALPHFDIVLYDTGDLFSPPEGVRTDSALLASAGTMGRHLGRIAIEVDAQGRPGEVRHEVVPMSEMVGVSDRMVRLLEEYQERLKLEQVLENRFRGPHPDGKYLGSESCRECHEADHAIWKDTAHAHAYDVLVEKGNAWDPECAVCHSTGFSYRSGFLSPDDPRDLDQVGCEACHGPGERHVATEGSVTMGPVGAEGCRSCHTAMQTPHFDFEEFFATIEHGR